MDRSLLPGRGYFSISHQSTASVLPASRHPRRRREQAELCALALRAGGAWRVYVIEMEVKDTNIEPEDAEL